MYWKYLNRIKEQLIKLINYGINFTKNRKIEAFVEPDYAGNTETRTSTMMGNSPISWCSKLQSSISTSIAES